MRSFTRGIIQWRIISGRFASGRARDDAWGHLMLAVTIDIDWAPDVIVDAVVGLFDDARVPLTLFCTDHSTDISGKSSVLSSRYHSRHEIGIHPNFASSPDPGSVYRNLLMQYPEARGFRSHNGYGSWPISETAIRNGLSYQVECTVFPVDVPPFKLVETENYYVFTTRFMDSRKLNAGEFGWSLAEAGLTSAVSDPDLLFIMTFHPNIVFYDMIGVDEYATRKRTYHEPVEKDSFLHNAPRGPVKLIRELCAAVDLRCFVTINHYGRSQRLWA